MKALARLTVPGLVVACQISADAGEADRSRAARSAAVERAREIREWLKVLDGLADTVGGGGMVRP